MSVIFSSLLEKPFTKEDEECVDFSFLNFIPGVRRFQIRSQFLTNDRGSLTFKLSNSILVASFGQPSDLVRTQEEQQPVSSHI